jgi:hypothetical protein
MHSAIVAEDNNQYELIEATSVDLFCDERGIERVGLLKIDTEGSDLDILVGATRLLSRSGIDFIVVEVGFYEKQRHVGLCQFLEWLTPLGYHLFGVYEQSWQRGGAARIDFANALFAREGLIAYK